MVLTRMPTADRSRAIGSVMPTMPPFDAEYAAWPIWPSNAATDAMLTIAPRWPSASSGSVFAIAAADWRSMLNVPSRLTLITKSNSFCGIGSLLRSTVRAGAAETGRVHEHPQRPHLRRRGDRRRAVVLARHVALDEEAADLGGHGRAALLLEVGDHDPYAPSAASWRADASPMPDAPPVTMAEAPLQVEAWHLRSSR